MTDIIEKLKKYGVVHNETDGKFVKKLFPDHIAFYPNLELVEEMAEFFQEELYENNEIVGKTYNGFCDDEGFEYELYEFDYDGIPYLAGWIEDPTTTDFIMFAATPEHMLELLELD